MTRRLTRRLEVNLDAIARQLLLDHPVPTEVVLELYRWIAVTSVHHGRRWPNPDLPLKWEGARYPGIRGEFGLRQWTKYPVTRYDFGLMFTSSSRDFLPKIRDVILRAAFGNTEQLRRWRRAHGSRKCTIDCQVLTRGADRWRDPLRVTALGRRKPQLNVSYNTAHRRARRLYSFVLMPYAEGWELVVVYGVGDPRRGSVSAWRAENDDGSSCEALRSIPVQRCDESVSEFMERVCDYAESVVVE